MPAFLKVKTGKDEKLVFLPDGKTNILIKPDGVSVFGKISGYEMLLASLKFNTGVSEKTSIYVVVDSDKIKLTDAEGNELEAPPVPWISVEPVEQYGGRAMIDSIVEANVAVASAGEVRALDVKRVVHEYVKENEKVAQAVVDNVKLQMRVLKTGGDLKKAMVVNARAYTELVLTLAGMDRDPATVSVFEIEDDIYRYLVTLNKEIEALVIEAGGLKWTKSPVVEDNKLRVDAAVLLGSKSIRKMLSETWKTVKKALEAIERGDKHEAALLLTEAYTKATRVTGIIAAYLTARNQVNFLSIVDRVARGEHVDAVLSGYGIKDKAEVRMYKSIAKMVNAVLGERKAAAVVEEERVRESVSA